MAPTPVAVLLAVAPVYATCGTASTNSSLRFSTAPVNSAQNYTLCGTGTAGSVTTSSTQYSWSCTGSIGDSTSDDVSCNVSRYYTVTATASGGNGSIASGSDSQQVAGGQSATITAQPATGYAPLFTTSCSGAQSGNSYTINSVTSNCSVSVTFAVSQSPSSDPGSGLWLPTSSTTRVIADQSGSAKLTSYVPGCLNGEYPTNGSSSGCAIKSSYTGIPAGLTSTTTVTMGAGNILGIRYTTNPSVTTTYKSIKVDGYDGGNVGNSMKVWLSSSPTAEYAATATGCKMTSTTHPTIYSGPMAGDCLLSPNTRYYLFLQISDACTNCRFQIYEGGSDFLK